MRRLLIAGFRDRAGEAHPRRRQLRHLFALLLSVPLLVAGLGTPAATADDLSDALAQQRALQAKIASQKAQVNLLGERVRSAYATGQTSMLEIILGASSFNDVLSELGYYLDVGQQDQALAAQIAQDIRDVAALHDAVTAVRADTDELRGLVAKQK